MISVMAAVFALAISGCKKSEINDPEIYKPSARQFHVNLTDAPGDFKRLDITVDKVEAWHDSQGWIPLSSSFRTINVISLADGAKTSLASASYVQTGHYSRLRIHFVDANSVTVHSAVTIGTLFIEAGSVSRLTWGGPADQWVEIPIDREVSSSAGVEVLLDFDAAASVYAGSNSYVINPVMREIANAITGARGIQSGTRTAIIIQGPVINEV